MNLTKNMNGPLTWLDVERRFKEATANYTIQRSNIVSIQCYLDGAEIEYFGNKSDAISWVCNLFERSVQSDGEAVILQIGQVRYTISYIESGKELFQPGKNYPLWQEQTYLTDAQQNNFPNRWGAGPKIVAFHSFKGGVGRTTSLMTYAAAYLNRPNVESVKILLVDADLEAPGISFWLNNENQPSVSFIKMLEAVHYPPSDVNDSLEYFASELRKTSINVEGAGREVFILPAALRINEIMDMQVRPEHLAKNLENPWQLSDCLHILGKKLEVDIVMIDLRAGLSELASPILFDPRIEHFFVTTVAPQSIAGMAEILRQLFAFQKSLPEQQRKMAKPSLIISLLTNQLKQLDVYTDALVCLNQAYPAIEDEAVSQGIEWLEAEFHESLMSIGSVRQALELLPKSSLFKLAEIWAAAREDSMQLPEFALEMVDASPRLEAQNLFETCEKFQFAERAATDDMLITDPLRNLAKHFSNDLPNIVSIGAKGAGKTFTFLQICKTKTWGSFLQKLGQNSSTLRNSLIYPLLVSTNVEQDSLEVVKAVRKNCEEKLEFLSPIGTASINSKITAELRSIDTDWDAFWEKMVLEEFSENFSTLESMNDWLILKDQSIVLIIDGIEDLFDSPEDSEIQRSAIKSLLQFPNRLNQLDNRKIGLVCFARADYVQAVIRQNLAQYLSRFQPFRLEWTPESFLRLAYWVCGKSEIIGADPDSAERQTTEQLMVSLERLWGKKMGSDGSKEASTARWVFAALCDLNGRLQARDLVRFLKISAKLTMRDRNVFWADRVLAPEAIRKSLPECSNEKVKEAASEIKVLQQWQEALQATSADLRKVPFSATAVGLNNEKLAVLRELGIVYEDVDQIEEQNRFYLPEIYRWGLGFQSSAGGRPRVQALLKRNLGRMPF